MATWNAAFNASPAGGDNPSFGDDKIRELKTTLVDRFIKEHYFDISEGGAQPRQGLHRAGSAVAFYQNAAPTQRNSANLSVADAGIFFVDSADKNIKVWDGDSFENVKPAVAVAADTALSSNDADALGGYAPAYISAVLPGVPILTFVQISSSSATLVSMSIGEMRIIYPQNIGDFSAVTLPSDAGGRYFVLASRHPSFTEFRPGLYLAGQTFWVQMPGTGVLPSDMFGAAMVIRMV